MRQPLGTIQFSLYSVPHGLERVNSRFYPRLAHVVNDFNLFGKLN